MMEVTKKFFNMFKIQFNTLLRQKRNISLLKRFLVLCKHRKGSSLIVRDEEKSVLENGY